MIAVGTLAQKLIRSSASAQVPHRQIPHIGGFKHVCGVTVTSFLLHPLSLRICLPSALQQTAACTDCEPKLL
jgi:hypothetical protein